MNAHQRRKHIRHHRPLIQQITATLTLLDMPLRAKDMQDMLLSAPLRAVSTARKYERSMPGKDWVVEPFYSGSKWSKSVYAKQLRREFKQMNELRDEIDKICGMRADTFIKDDVLDASTYSSIGIRPSEKVDRPLGEDRPRVRLFGPWNGKDVRAHQGVREQAQDSAGAQGSPRPGSEITPAQHLGSGLQEVRTEGEGRGRNGGSEG